MGQKVLVFESDASFAGELRNELLKLGCSVNVVDDGNTGLQQASSTKPDLILLSIELPRMNGFSVCNKLKKDPSLKDIPLIIMSSESSDETFEQHRKLRTRAEDYVHKPIGFDDLLARIQPFVVLGPSPSSDGASVPISMGSEALEDEDIVVDDMSSIPPARDEIGAEESTMSYATAAAHGNGQLSIGDALPDALPSERPAPLPAFTLSEPPAPVVPSAPPHISERPAYDGGASEELSQALARVRELEDEVDRVRREADEAKARMSVAPTAGKVSSKEFLDLREQLNKKDKEILSLKENLGKKDKEIVEARDKSLALERQSSDLEDKAIQQERAIAEAEEKIESLSADKDQAKKAGEDFKRRAERAQHEADARIKEAAELKQRYAEEAAHREASAAQKLEEAAREREAALAQAAAEADARLAQAVAEADARRAQEVEEAALSAQRTADRERTEALAQTETKLKAEQDSKLAALHRAHQDETNRLKTEHASALEALGNRLEEEKATALAELRTQLETDRDEKVAAAEASAGERVGAAEAAANERAAAAEADRDQKLAAAQADADARVRAAEADRDEKVATAEAAGSAKAAAAETDAASRVAAAETDAASRVAAAETDAASRVAAAESEAASKVAAAEASAADRVATLEAQTQERVTALDARVAELDRDLGATRSLLSEREALLAERETTINDLSDQVAQLTEARNGLDRDVRSAQDRLVVLEADLAATKQSLDETKSELDTKSVALARATSKIDSDKGSLDRAKDALAIALAQIEEAESRAG